MDKSIRIRRNRKITDVLREMNVGESVVLKGASDSVKTIAYRMGKEGLKFSLTKKGVTNGLRVERVE